MKVLQINSVCGVGSTGRIATDIHEVLTNEDYESYIAYGRAIFKDFNNAIKIGNKMDIYTHVAKTRILDKHGFGSKQATLDFIEKVKRINPDILHLHNIHGYYINIEVLFDYIKTENKPVVWTLHDCWGFTGHCSHFDYIGCNKWKTGCYECPQKREYPASFVLDSSESNYISKSEISNGVKKMTIVTPSDWLSKLVKQSFLKEYPVKVINNGINLNIFRPTNSNFILDHDLKDKFIILGVANVWNDRKGFNYFLDLAKKINSNQIIILVGLSKKQKRNLPSNIIGICRTNSINELVKIYSSANVYVNLTLEDTFPTTNIEALASGIPIITFNTGGSTEVINKETGIIIEQGNINQLIKEINKIENADSEFNKTRLVEIANNQFNRVDKYREYLDLYKYILGRV